MFQPDRSSKIVGACSALHNFALLHGDTTDMTSDMDNSHVPEIITTLPDSSAGIAARNQLIHRVFS